MKTVDDIPVLSGETLSGHSAEFRRTRGAIFRRVAEELGDIGRIRFFGAPIVIVCSPELVHETLVEKQRSFEKSFATRIMFYPFAGRGLFTAEGEHWRRQRKLMSPLFHPAAIRGYATTMNEVIARCLSTWKDGEVIDAGREMTRITMAVAGKILFDTDTLDESDELSDSVRAMFEYISDGSGSLSLVVRAMLSGALRDLGALPDPLGRGRDQVIEALHRPLPLPTEKRRRLFRAIERLDDKIARMIRERRESASARDDLMSRLLAARDEDDGSFMTDKQVRDEAVTLFVAGHETTATSTTWSLYLLSRHPEAYRAWKEEVSRVENRPPTAEDAAHLPYTRGVFREALRLYPPAFALDRVTTEDVTIGGYRLPKNTFMMIPVEALHHRASVFPDPERFDPTRFAPEQEAKRSRGAYIPFGAGPRVCIGMTFAELEAELLLAQIAQRFDFEAEDQRPIGADFHTALRPERPVRLRVRRVGG